MKFSILGPGGIAHSLAAAVEKLEGVEAYAVASRDYRRAKDFADKWGYQKAYGSYEEMIKDPEVELVYIATPHSHHYKYAKMCLENGKPVLVEKAFTVNAKQAEELLLLAKEKNLLVAEAIWSRYMPSRKMIDDIIASGEIGEIYSMTSSFGFPLTHVDRLVNPNLAGGALLDLSVYTITSALMTFHSRVKEIQASAVMSSEGIDLMNSITLVFEDDKMALLHGNMTAMTSCSSVVYGTEGYLEIKMINNCEEVCVYDTDRRLLKSYPVPEQINGYEYEVLACKKAIEDGKIECAEMPHEETIRVMKILDRVREIWGLRYPCE